MTKPKTDTARTRKRKPLSWGQENFLRYLRNGEWHPWGGQPISCSGLRGLVARGLIECKENPADSAFSFYRNGEFRLRQGGKEWLNTQTN
jgi:hypothetical protein